MNDKKIRGLFVGIGCALAIGSLGPAADYRVAAPGGNDGRDTPTAPVDGAPSCVAPTPVGDLPFVDTGNSCNGLNDIDDYNNFDLGGVCNTVPYPGPDVVYRFVVGLPANNVAATLTPGAPADLGIFVVSDCDDGLSCIAFEDQIGGGAVSEIELFDLDLGDYFIWIDSYYASGPSSCGDYSLAVDGSVPAELVEFSVE